MPYYAQGPAREAAKHLRLTASRFLSERATPDDVDEAIQIWRDAAEKVGGTGRRVCDPDRALAAAEALAAVWLHEKHFELEHRIGDPPVAETDDEGHVWVTVQVHVPALDIDCWLDGSHTDHPDNQNDDPEGGA